MKQIYQKAFKHRKKILKISPKTFHSPNDPQREKKTFQRNPFKFHPNAHIFIASYLFVSTNLPAITHLKNAYSIGLMAELLYPMHPMSKNMVISNLLWQTCGEELIRAIWLTCERI
jgi:hypothetical protein